MYCNPRWQVSVIVVISVTEWLDKLCSWANCSRLTLPTVKLERWCWANGLSNRFQVFFCPCLGCEETWTTLCCSTWILQQFCSAAVLWNSLMFRAASELDWMAFASHGLVAASELTQCSQTQLRIWNLPLNILQYGHNLKSLKQGENSCWLPFALNQDHVYVNIASMNVLTEELII